MDNTKHLVEMEASIQEKVIKIYNSKEYLDGVFSRVERCSHNILPEEVLLNLKTNEVVILPCKICRGTSIAYNNFVDKFYRGDSGFLRQCDNTLSVDEIKFPLEFGVEVECVLDTDTVNGISEEFVVLNDMENIFSVFIINDKPFIKHVKYEQNKLALPQSVKLWIAGADGSINRRNFPYSFEFKSPIFRGDIGMRSIREFFATIKPRFNESCGLHIHVNPYISNTTILNDEFTLKLSILSAFIDNFYLPLYVDRLRMSNNYANLLMLNERVHLSSRYHVLFLFTNILENKNVHDIRQFRDSMNHGSHFASTSFITYHRTVEFRTLHGTRNLDLLRDRINTHMATIVAAHTMSIDEIIEFIRNALQLSRANGNKANYVYDRYISPITGGILTKDTAELKRKVTQFIDSIVHKSLNSR
jgi:hypothetical protein